MMMHQGHILYILNNVKGDEKVARMFGSVENLITHSHLPLQIKKVEQRHHECRCDMERHTASPAFVQGEPFRCM